MKNILVLGATGSIGDSVLSVIEQNSEKLDKIDEKLYQIIKK